MIKIKPIFSLTQRELIEVHLCLSYIKAREQAITTELQQKADQVIKRIKPIKHEQWVMELLGNIENKMNNYLYFAGL